LVLPEKEAFTKNNVQYSIYKLIKSSFIIQLDEKCQKAHSYRASVKLLREYLRSTLDVGNVNSLAGTRTNAK